MPQPIPGGLFDNGNSGTSKSINWHNGLAQKLALTGNASLTLINPVIGQVYRLRVQQDATGNRTVIWPATVKFTGAAFAITPGANKSSMISLLWDGTNYWEVARALNL